MTSQIPNPMPQGARPYHKMREQKLTSRSETVAFVIILRVDRFMSEARALTNLIGTRVATFVVSKWEDAVDERRVREHRDYKTDFGSRCTRTDELPMYDTPPRRLASRQLALSVPARCGHFRNRGHMQQRRPAPDRGRKLSFGRRHGARICCKDRSIKLTRDMTDQ